MSADGEYEVASEVMSVLMENQRHADDSECTHRPCENCALAHLDRVLRFIREKLPIDFVLPAFPGKSPNPQKVLGPLPDMAEELSLRFLNNVCDKIREVYPRGARIIICSDGRVFGDIVGVQDSDITRYRAGLREVIAQHAYTSIQLFGLDDEYPGLGHWATRSRLMNRYGESIEQLRRRVRREDDLTILYRGLSRILLEDADRSGEPGSGVAPDLNSERRAYGVMQRSRAWGRLIAERFPHAVRLSIHPQPCGSRKLGIRLLDAADNWITPWHGVAVDVAGHFVLMKRREAENLHARLVYANGRASHYVLTDTRVPGDERSPRVA